MSGREKLIALIQLALFWGAIAAVFACSTVLTQRAYQRLHPTQTANLSEMTDGR